MINGLMPCGLVYAATAAAAAAADTTTSLLIMLSFGLGTVPAMLTLGLSANLLAANYRNHLFKAATILVIAFGLATSIRAGQLIASSGLPISGTSTTECIHH